MIVLHWLSWLFLGAGSLVAVATAVAIVRMPTFYTRVHAASVNEALGPALILLGLVLQAGGDVEVIIKLLLILVFLVLTGPLASHALAKSAYKHGVPCGTYHHRKASTIDGRMRKKRLTSSGGDS